MHTCHVPLGLSVFACAVASELLTGRLSMASLESAKDIKLVAGRSMHNRQATMNMGKHTIANSHNILIDFLYATRSLNFSDCPTKSQGVHNDVIVRHETLLCVALHGWRAHNVLGSACIKLDHG